MMICPTLRKMQRSYVRFDPKNAEHLKAFEMLCLGTHAKQHETLRFELEDNFIDVRSMMFHKVGSAWMSSVTKAA